MEEAERLKNEGNARKAAGDLAGAAERYRAALALAPAYTAALYNLGIVLRESAQFEEAERCFRRIAELDAGDAEALFNLGALLRRRRALEEAASVLARASALAPNDARLCFYLGQVHAERYTDASLAEAERCLEKAIVLDPDLAEAHYVLGTVHAFEGRAEQAMQDYTRASALAPSNAGFRSALLNEKLRACDWTGLEALCEATRKAAVDPAAEAIPPFVVLSIPSSPSEQLAAARKHARAVAERVRDEHLEPAATGGNPAPGGRRRVAYLSSEFHSHATAYLAAELFELHDRSRFEVFAFSYGPIERSATRARLERAFDRFVDVRNLSDARAARAIRDAGIEILVDLKGYTFRSRPEILALRPAPVQVNYLGYPGTMGASFVDYIVADRFVAPAEDEACFDEKIVTLPHCYQVNDRRRSAGPSITRAAAGLPADGFIYCCFNQSYKILPEVFASWMRLLAAVPASVLWLLEWSGAASANLRREAARAGVDPARLVFSPLASVEQHLARMRIADLFLDTSPVNAHTTASEALWSGLPVLTCPGKTFVSRVASSLLHNVGLEALVAASMHEYEAIAVRLARDPAQLSEYRARLDEARAASPLFDTPRLVRHLEAAYDRMWGDHASGSKASFAVAGT